MEGYKHGIFEYNLVMDEHKLGLKILFICSVIFRYQISEHDHSIKMLYIKSMDWTIYYIF